MRSYDAVRWWLGFVRTSVMVENYPHQHEEAGEEDEAEDAPLQGAAEEEHLAADEGEGLGGGIAVELVEVDWLERRRGGGRRSHWGIEGLRE
ncbi:hypothetical protein SASPL_136110 [Salvia splendens]|uniref:Uncharacterized protein n=1 Tax=Salvia splendens TaxID=180675 RepID=A0A8X8X1G6_SALSN|nr:hypothetical protein SASPL_136110 [Salvia splendens]